MIASNQACGRSASQLITDSVSRPGVMSISRWLPTSAMVVAHTRLRNRPVRVNRVSSSPIAVTGPIRSGWSTSRAP